MDHLSNTNKVLWSGFILLLYLPQPPGPLPGRAPRQPWTVPPNCSFAQGQPLFCSTFVVCQLTVKSPWQIADLHPDESFFRSLPKKRLGWDKNRKRQGNGLPLFSSNSSPCSEICSNSGIPKWATLVAVREVVACWGIHQCQSTWVSELWP